MKAAVVPDVHVTEVRMTEGILPARSPNTIGTRTSWRNCRISQNVTTRTVGDRVGGPWVQHACGRCEWCQRKKIIVLSLSKSDYLNIN
jgi:Zn-dependent alcohol dehydrogenase